MAGVNGFLCISYNSIFSKGVCSTEGESVMRKSQWDKCVHGNGTIPATTNYTYIFFADYITCFLLNEFAKDPCISRCWTNISNLGHIPFLPSFLLIHPSILLSF